MSAEPINMIEIPVNIPVRIRKWDIIDVIEDESVFNKNVGTDYVNLEHPYIVDLRWAGRGCWLLIKGFKSDGTSDVWVLEVDCDDLTPKYDTAKKIISGLKFAHPAPTVWVDAYNERIKLIYSKSAGGYTMDVFDLDWNLVKSGAASGTFPNNTDVVAGFAPMTGGKHWMMSFPNANRHYIRYHLVNDQLSIAATWTAARLRTAWLLEHSYIYADGLFIKGIHEVSTAVNGKYTAKYVPFVSFTGCSSTSAAFHAVMAPLWLPLKNWAPADWLHPGIHVTKYVWFVWLEAMGWPWGRRHFRLRATRLDFDIFNANSYNVFMLPLDNGASTFNTRTYNVMLPVKPRLLEITVVPSGSVDITITGGSEGETITAERLFNANGVSNPRYIRIEYPPRLLRISLSGSNVSATVVGWAWR